ncbi:MAG TPA: PilN domain-containing protein [Solirubrobacterales bacterium]
MRPINLIPPHERRGSQAPLRSGPLVYVLVGALVLVLAGVTAVVLTGNKVSEREGEVATLTSEDATVQAEAERLTSYVTFQTTSEQRVATVQSLADSRFDWERVMRELALILPSDIWLLELNASASGEVAVGSGSGGLRGSIAGPALELEGCATDQDAVAGFVRALKDIDGVTRVGLESSELGQEERATSEEVTSDSNESSSAGCRANMAKFEITVAFDAAPVADLEAEAEAAASTAAAPPAGEEAGSESSSTTETTSTESSGGGE